jgi:hypothetical protein
VHIEDEIELRPTQGHQAVQNQLQVNTAGADRSMLKVGVKAIDKNSGINIPNRMLLTILRLSIEKSDKLNSS